ncbi:MAG: carboxypeptidase-like regulatory domain-containing protein, partial [Bacteroidales bacterium]|nr:carboxypeptidase-like regulatory domain-containing protein [Bacteroidales bacterium]
MILKKTAFSLFVIMALLRGLTGQGIRGTISDAEGNPVPYASIFIRELSRGTTCNTMGNFSLPLPPGKYEIFFRSLGYREVTRTIS